MEDKILELENKIAQLNLTIQQLDERINKIEKGSIGSGVYLDGVPDYAKDYITKEGE